jgi:thioredoxin 1
MTMASALGQVLTMTDEAFNRQVIAATIPVLVEFGAPWCPPCRAAAPILAQLSDELAGKLTIATVDTDMELRVAASLGIMGLPTFVLYKGGEPVEKFVGFQPKAKLLEKIRPHLDS